MSLNMAMIVLLRLCFFVLIVVLIDCASDESKKVAISKCDESATTSFGDYFTAMKNIYINTDVSKTCLPQHMKCGWPIDSPRKPGLPLYVLSVGLEGAGHHLWTELLNIPVFDCVWVNGRHYSRDTGDGVPRTTVNELKRGILEQFKMRTDSGKKKCQRIYDAEDSFPTGAIRKSGRIFMHPDIVNLQQLDGVLMNVKYLLIVRNTTVRNSFIH